MPHLEAISSAPRKLLRKRSSVAEGMEPFAVASPAASWGPEVSKPSLDSSGTKNCTRSHSAPRTDVADRQDELFRQWCLQTRATGWCPSHISQTLSGAHSKCAHEEEQQPQGHRRVGCAPGKSSPRTSGLVDCTFACSSGDAKRARSVPAVPTHHTASHSHRHFFLLPRDLPPALPISCIRRSTSAGIFYGRARRPTSPRSASSDAALQVDRGQRWSPQWQIASDALRPCIRENRLPLRSISDMAVRRRRALEQRTAKSAPLLLQLTSPSSSTARLQLETIRAQNACLAKHSSCRGTCVSASECLPSASRTGDLAGVFSGEVQPQGPDPHRSHEFCPSECFLAGGCRISRFPATPAAVRRSHVAASGRAEEAIRCPSAAFHKENAAELSKEFKNRCKYRSGGGGKLSLDSSRSWTCGLLPQSDIGFSTSRSRSFSEPAVTSISQRPSTHPHMRTVVPPSNQVGGSKQSPQARIASESHSTHASAELSPQAQVGGESPPGASLAKAPVQHANTSGPRISETLNPQRVSPGGPGIEGFVKGVQCCINRLISNFQSGFELHNGYGDLVVPEYWTREYPASHQTSQSGQLLVSCNINITGEHTEGTSVGERVRRLPYTENELVRGRIGELGYPLRDISQSGETGAPAYCKHLEDVGSDVVFAIDAPPADASAASASCYYAVEGVVGRGAHGAVFRAKRFIKSLKSGSPTATASTPKASSAASEVGNDSEEPVEGMDEVEVEEDEVALKIIDLDGALRTQCTDACGRARYIDRVMTEAKVLAQLEHENIVKFFEAFQWPPCYLVLVTEYLPGGSLRDLYKSSGPLPEAVIALVLKDVTKALEYLHERLDGDKCKPMCMHRDIKAANILLTETGRAKLIDFGISFFSDDFDTEYAGTPQWMAPEMAEIFCRRHQRTESTAEADVHLEPYTCSVDIWSLGITAYELAMGCLPWPQGAKLDQLMHVIAYGPAPRINLNEGFEKSFCYFVEKCLRKNGRERGSASELLRHDFFKKFCSGKRPQTHQELKEAVEIFNGKRQASMLTTVVRYFTFWGRRGSGGSTTSGAAKLRIPVGRLEKWGSGYSVGSTKTCSADGQRCTLSLVSSSQPVMFPKGSNATRGITSLTLPQTDHTADRKTSSHSPIDPGKSSSHHSHTRASARLECTRGSGSCGETRHQIFPIIQEPSKSLAAKEGSVCALGPTEQNGSGQELDSSREADCNHGGCAQVPIDASLTTVDAAGEEQTCRQSGLFPDVAQGNPPQSSQSFFSLFLSAFQGSSKRGTIPATDAPANEPRATVEEEGQDVDAQRRCRDPDTNLLTRGSCVDPPKTLVHGFSVPQVGGLGHPLPRRFRKTRDPRTRRRSRRREASASFVKGADRVLGLFRRVGIVNGSPSTKDSRQNSNSSSGNSSDAAGDTGMHRCGPSPSDNAGGTKCVTQMLPSEHTDYHRKGECRNEISAVSGLGESPRGCRGVETEPGLSVGNHAVFHTSRVTSTKPDAQNSCSRSSHFYNLLESPTTLATGVPHCGDELSTERDPDLKSPLSLITNSEHPPTRDKGSENYSPTLAPGTLQPTDALTAQSFNSEPVAALDGREASSGCTEGQETPEPSYPPISVEAHRSGEENVQNREEVDHDKAQDILTEVTRLAEPRAADASEEQRSWLPGPHLYKRLLDGINQFVEVSGIRRPVGMTATREPAPNDTGIRSGEGSMDFNNRSDSPATVVERLDSPQAPSESTESHGLNPDPPKAQEQTHAVQSSWLWNLLYRDQGSPSRPDARDPSSVAASYLSDAVPQAEVLQRAQLLPLASVSDMYAPVGHTPRALSRHEYCTRVEDLHPVDVVIPPCIPLGEASTTRHIDAVHQAIGMPFANVGRDPCPTRKSLPAGRRTGAALFTTLAEDLEMERIRQHSALEHHPTDQRRAYCVYRIPVPSCGDPATFYPLHSQLHDPAAHQSVAMGTTPGQWILPGQFQPDLCGVLGLNSRSLATFPAHPIPAPDCWEGHHAGFSGRWHDTAVRTAPTHPMAAVPYEAEDVRLGPPTHHQKPAQQ